jgi:type IV pilus assembly protein PilQ
VSFNDFITLKVRVSDNQAPSTSRIIKKTISTTLMIKSGETVVIGGILKESDTEDEAGVPVLKDIPFIGWAFKAKSKVQSRSELLIFLTPTVLPAPARTL